MRKKTKKILLAAFLAVLFVPSFLPAKAQNAPNTKDLRRVPLEQYADVEIESYKLMDVVATLTFLLISLLGVFFVLLLLYSGYLLILSNGKDKQAEKAKGLISNAVLGLLIVLASYFIAQAVFNRLSGVSRTEPVDLYSYSKAAGKRA